MENKQKTFGSAHLKAYKLKHTNVNINTHCLVLNIALQCERGIGEKFFRLGITNILFISPVDSTTSNTNVPRLVFSYQHGFTIDQMFRQMF